MIPESNVHLRVFSVHVLEIRNQDRNGSGEEHRSNAYISFLDDSRLCSGVRCFDTAVCMCCYLICHMADNCPKQPKKAATYKERKSRNMKKKEVLLRLGAMAMIAALGIAPVTSGISAMAATSTASTNNTATKMI